ncbi:MAG: hypothetical protein IH934_04375 [Nanoarchaeota archaeon]|nr:hypothetical protein [Nanoarchaeota archaeon]
MPQNISKKVDFLVGKLKKVLPSGFALKVIVPKRISKKALFLIDKLKKGAPIGI